MHTPAMEIRRVQWADFARVLLRVNSYPEIEKPIPHATILMSENGYSRFIQCENARIAERLMAKHTSLTWSSSVDFERIASALDYSAFDIGPSLFIQSPIWSELRPWLEANMTDDFSVTIMTGRKRISFKSPDDYLLMRMMMHPA